MKKTKAQLEQENEVLRSTTGNTISNCTFNGSPSDEHCDAVRELAIAIQRCAEALKRNDSLLHIGTIQQINESA